MSQTVHHVSLDYIVPLSYATRVLSYGSSHDGGRAVAEATSSARLRSPSLAKIRVR